MCDVYADEKVSGDLDKFLEDVKEKHEGPVKNMGIQLVQLVKLCVQQHAFIKTSPLCLAQPGDPKLLNRVDICDCDPTEFAEQLALMEHDVLQRVTPNEFLHSAWMKKDAETKAPNITHMTNIFNNVGHWFEESILLAPGNAERQRLLKFIIACAKACLEINELNGLMTFVCTAQSRNISRLSKIWKGKLKEDSDQLVGLVMASNFKELRKLQAERSPYIPYLAITHKDITFIDDGNSDFISGTNLINWEKLHMLGNSIDKLVTRNGSYNNVIMNTKIISYIRNMTYTMSEDEAYKKSLEIEPKVKPK